MMLSRAKEILHAACTPFGIVAAQGDRDNYTRIWSRDAVISGIAGILIDDETIIDALQKSILSLLSAQKEQGQLPSNVLLDENGELKQVSYGTMSARIDAVSWFVIGAALISKRLRDIDRDALYLGVQKAFDVLSIWEYNGRGLVYVPMGGNWADEYVTHGYVLYDQLLRAKALSLASKAWHHPKWEVESRFIYDVIVDNYWQPSKTMSTTHRYRPVAADRGLSMPELPYWLCSLSPTGYDTRFDLFANALALLSPICESAQADSIFCYVEQVMAQHGGLVPTFYPIIYADSLEWEQLQAHHLYRFKNESGCFHNGGIWAMTMGWLGLAAIKWDRSDLVQQWLTSLEQYLPQVDGKTVLYEYLSSLDFVAGGVPDLSFSAAGILFLGTDQSCLSKLL